METQKFDRLNKWTVGEHLFYIVVQLRWYLDSTSWDKRKNRDANAKKRNI